MRKDDQDAVRAVGYVAIAFAGLEQDLQRFVESAQPIMPVRHLSALSFSEMAHRLRKAAERYGSEQDFTPDGARALYQIQQWCGEALRIAKERNQLLHNPAMEKIPAHEIYRLVEQITLLRQRMTELDAALELLRLWQYRA